MQTGDQHSKSPSDVFFGYPRPKSNTIYCPNQFFDLVIPYSSRGTVRLLSYMIRRTLGWCDEDGKPQEVRVLASYKDLIEGAGIGRTCLSAAISEATKARFIRCIRKGAAKSPGNAGMSALYELNWDESEDPEYIIDPKLFRGFFSGNGNCTYIPNVFFDYTIRHTSLSVIKVVASIIRHTIGYQTRHGTRRQRVALSFSDIQNYARIRSSSTVNLAVQYALENNHIQIADEGYFDPNAGKNSQATKYSILWEDAAEFALSQAANDAIGSKIEAEGNPASVRKSKRKSPRERFENRSGDKLDISSKIEAGSVQKSKRDQFENRSDNINNTLNNTSKQQQQSGVGSLSSPAVVAESDKDNDSEKAMSLLSEHDFDENTARRFTQKYGPQEIFNQCRWLPFRNPKEHPAKLLRRSIEGRYPDPTPKPRESDDLEKFVSFFYAYLAGSTSNPVAPVTTSDIRSCKRFFEEASKTMSPNGPVDIASSFAKYARTKEPPGSIRMNSLTLLLQSHGDRFLAAEKKKTQANQKKQLEASKLAHREHYWSVYARYVQERMKTLPEENPEAWHAFELKMHELKELYVNPSQHVSNDGRKELLEDLDRPKRRRRVFYEFFMKEYPERVVFTFWQWDQECNPERYGMKEARA